jgi:PAS domain S-box-containing protein
MGTLNNLLLLDGFMPHGCCFLWNAKLIWLHALSDGLIFAAYLSVSLTLIYLGRQRRDLPYRRIFWCFGAFIVSCGFSHGMDVWTLWHPDYWISGVIKAVTAGASVATAILLMNVVPQAVAVPSAGRATQAEAFVPSKVAGFTPRSLLLAYGLALVTTAATLLVITAGGPGITAVTPVVVFVIPVMLSAYVGGLFPGLFCTALGTLVSIYFILPPAHSWRIANPADHERWLGLALAGVLVSLLSESQHRLRLRAQDDDARMAGIINSAMDAIITVDERLRIMLFNPAAERVFGCRSADVLGRRVEQFIPNLVDCVERLRASGQPNIVLESIIGSHEISARRADGTKFPVEASVAQAEVAREKQFTVVLRDISERKQAEAFRSRLAALVESSDDAIVGKSLEGAITSWNRGAEKLYGFAAEEMVGKPISIIVPPERRQELQRIFDTIRKGGAVKHLDTVRLRKDGSQVIVSVSTSPIWDREGRVAGASSIARDITERKRAEEALAHRTEALERSNADLEQFAYVASHDLKEPLRAMIGCIRVLQHRYQGKLDERADEFIAHAVDGGTRMEKLIDDLLAFSRLGTRGGKFNDVACRRVLDSALQNLAVAIEESSAVVTEDPLPTVHGDVGQLVSLFQNFIGNAIKFRGSAPPRIHVGAQRDGTQWQFSVHDNGIGIDHQYFDRIFGIFQRLHTRREYPGTGIGLALCKKIVERHGGRVWVESVVGEGTTFHFTLEGAVEGQVSKVES